MAELRGECIQNFETDIHDFDADAIAWQHGNAKIGIWWHVFSRDAWTRCAAARDSPGRALMKR
jgi:hypothetical protein